ncbi:MAG: three-Cys-motif partner protein TcmP [Planctomycetota bacterium]
MAIVAGDDNPCVYEVGDWTLDKLYILAQYIAVSTNAMVGSPHFSGYHYIDLFAGAGVCALRERGGKRYPGSALLAACADKAFATMSVVEQDSEKLQALKARLLRCVDSGSENLCGLSAYAGDCNNLAGKIAESVPARSLNLAFVDPFALGVDFTTIQTLASAGQVDFLILIADDMDIVRNIDKVYYPASDGQLDSFFGRQSSWRQSWDELKVRTADNMRDWVADTYATQLRSLGYAHVERTGIPRQGRQLYSLLYASRSKVGLKFWRIAKKYDLGGSRPLFADY